MDRFFNDMLFILDWCFAHWTLFPTLGFLCLFARAVAGVCNAVADDVRARRRGE